MTGTAVIRGVVAVEADVFAIRRQARELGAALGLEEPDQIRLAAALSEVGRRLLARHGPLTVDFAVVPDEPNGGEAATERPLLSITVTGIGPADDALVGELGPTRQLVDRFAVRRNGASTVITMGRWLPERVAAISPTEIEEIAQQIAGLTAGTPLEELAEHNRQLLATLQQVEHQRDELLRLNVELEETNRGVVALYKELSDELEATNRGVVALYAELDQRNDEIRAASEAKSRFLANASHELRAPVTAIIGLCQLLKAPTSVPLTEEQAGQLGLIESSARGLLGLVNQLLDLAKAESGRLEATPVATDLKAVFDSLRGMLKAVPRSESTELVIVDPEGVPTLHTDPVLLTRVLLNLLTNGLKFTPDGEVRLTAQYSPRERTVSLAVSDTGIGIPPEEHERIFEEFHQVRHALHAGVVGTGLGLPYTRRLVQILGGRISLESTPGHGSTFTVTLPVSDPARSPAGNITGPLRVLIADDDDAFRTAAAMILRAAGDTVIEAADGEAALAAIQQEPPDAVLLDLRLAGVDGFAVLAALSSNETLSHIPVVVLTAYPSDVADQPALGRATTVMDKAQTTLDSLPRIVREAAQTHLGETHLRERP